MGPEKIRPLKAVSSSPGCSDRFSASMSGTSAGVIRAGFERLVPNFRAEQAGLFPRSLQAFSPASSCRLKPGDRIPRGSA